MMLRVAASKRAVLAVTAPIAHHRHGPPSQRRRKSRGAQHAPRERSRATNSGRVVGCLEETRDEDLAARRDVLRERLALEALLEVGREDAEHRRTALVELEVELERAHLRVGEVTERVAGAVVARVLRRGPDARLDDAAEEEDLHKAERRQREKARVAVRDRGEGDALRGAKRRARERKVAGELEARVVHEHADDRHHGNTAVLALDSAAALEVLRLR